MVLGITKDIQFDVLHKDLALIWNWNHFPGKQA